MTNGIIRRMAALVILCALLVPTFALAGVTVDEKEGTIFDDGSGLVWPREAAVIPFESCQGGMKTWQEANAYVDCLNETEYLGETDWRLPTVDELAVLYRSKGLATGVANAYWSGTEHGRNERKAYLVKMKDGDIAAAGKNQPHAVWPVRSDEYETITVKTATNAVPAAVPREKFPITVTPGANGKITPTNLLTGQVLAAAGTNRVFTVRPYKGYIIESISVDGAPQNLDGLNLYKPFKVRLTEIAAPHAISATFTAAPSVKGFPTNLTPGDYLMSAKVCGSGYCSPPIEMDTLHLESASYFSDYYGSFFNDFNYYVEAFSDQINTQYPGLSCHANSSCTPFNGDTFSCRIRLSCTYGGQSGSGSIIFFFDKQ